MKALDVMVRNVVTVKPDDAVADAVRLLALSARILAVASRHS